MSTTPFIGGRRPHPDWSGKLDIGTGVFINLEQGSRLPPLVDLYRPHLPPTMGLLLQRKPYTMGSTVISNMFLSFQAHIGPVLSTIIGAL
jgi:hypothetical protein